MACDGALPDTAPHPAPTPSVILADPTAVEDSEDERNHAGDDSTAAAELLIDASDRGELTFDGRPLEHLPLRITCAPGEHTVTLAEGDRRKSVVVTVRAGETRRLTLAFDDDDGTQ